MHAVAITRTRIDGVTGYRGSAASPIDREEMARLLSEVTGTDLYTSRLRAGQPLPWILPFEQDAAAAADRVAALRERGLGAVSTTVADATPWTGRGRVSLELEEGAVVFAPDGLRVDLLAIRVVVLATLDQETRREEVERVMLNALGGAATAGSEITHYSAEGKQLRAAYLVLSERQRSIRLVQGAVSLAGAGAGRTSIEAFDRAIDALLDRLPSAIRDDRLALAPRGRSSFKLRGDGDRVTSNVRETDLAARVVGLAWLEQQIDPVK